LGFPHLLVEPIFDLQKLLVIAVFDELSFVNDRDVIAELGRTHPVGDKHRGFAFDQSAELFIDFGFALRIKRGGRLI
jgi:hypothetical protein